ncbi:MAG: beta-galactosidase trimerization domain-containing protein [Clostridia bacterium]|nr:beta-galactosidase trimerization domain-containing protein [Clostridia bacterium]
MSAEVTANTPWEERFGWYHYDGRAIYEYTGKDLDDAAELYKANGVTAVILFGAHFRFSFMAYWTDIEDFIARFTSAFHKKGIKVIEHHSTHLTYRPVDPEAFWKKNLAPGMQLSTYPGFREKSENTLTPEGAKLDDFAQIDGSTGQPCLSSYIHTEGKDVHWIFKHYDGNAHCFNHPAFEEAYWGHIRRIIEKAHIDGIMNDDVQWFGGGNSCACVYCRAKFREETGYELPDKEHWSGFFEHYERPDYIAWKKFKKKQSGDFHYRMDERYKSIGFRPMRPAYCCEVLPFDTTCYGFEPAQKLWDFIFQECCAVIKDSFVCFAGEAIHRFAMAKRNGKPPMALMYPKTAGSAYAAWALCRSWGQLYTGTGGDSRSTFDRPMRDFEKKHVLCYRDPVKRADAAFFFSPETRDYSDKDAPQKYMKPFMAYLESAYVSGVCCDMVFGTDAPETLSAFRVIIVPYVYSISDAEAEKLREYAENGGKLIVLGEFAGRDENCRERGTEERTRLLGMRSELRLKDYSGREEIGGKVFGNATSKYVFDKVLGEVIARGENGEALCVEEKTGKGKVIFHVSDVSDHPIQPAVWPRGEQTPCDRSFIPEMREKDGALLKLLIGGGFTSCSDENVIVSAFGTKAGTVVHFVNTKGFIADRDTVTSPYLPVPPFEPGAEKTGAITATISAEGVYSRAKLYSPEFDEEKTASVRCENGRATIEIPENTFAGYLLAILE